jgi:hypothetical protein
MPKPAQLLCYVGRKPRTLEQQALDDLNDAIAELQERERARDPNWSPRRPITPRRPT